MSEVLNYNCTALGDHEKVSCNNWKQGGSNALAIIESDFTVTDWESKADWDTDILAGKITLIENVKVQFPEPSPVEGENPIGGGSENILDTFDYEITYKDFNVTTANNDFYDALNERRFLVAMYHNEDQEVTVNTLYEANAIARAVTPELVGDKRHYLVTIRFRGKNIIPLYDMPSGVFNAD